MLLTVVITLDLEMADTCDSLLRAKMERDPAIVEETRK